MDAAPTGRRAPSNGQASPPLGLEAADLGPNNDPFDFKHGTFGTKTGRGRRAGFNTPGRHIRGALEGLRQSAPKRPGGGSPRFLLSAAEGPAGPGSAPARVLPPDPPARARKIREKAEAIGPGHIFAAAAGFPRSGPGPEKAPGAPKERYLKIPPAKPENRLFPPRRPKPRRALGRPCARPSPQALRARERNLRKTTKTNVPFLIK